MGEVITISMANKVLKLGAGPGLALLLPLLLVQCLFCLLLVVSARPEGGSHRAAAAEALSSQCDAQGPRQECGEEIDGRMLRLVLVRRPPSPDLLLSPPPPPPLRLHPPTHPPNKKTGWNGIPASECLSKGCCFSQAPTRQGELALRLPSCFRQNGGDSSYPVSTLLPPPPSPPGRTEEGGGPSAAAAAAGPAARGAARGTLSRAASAAPSLGADLAALDFSLTLPARDVARLTIGADQRWRVPAGVLPGVSGVERRERELLAGAGGSGSGSGSGSSGQDGNGGERGGSELEVEVVSSPSFAAVVRRKSSGSSPPSPLLDTRGSRLVFKDRYIELTTRLPEAGRGALYGLGERTSSSERLPLRRNEQGVPFTLWTRDAAAADADLNSYG